MYNAPPAFEAERRRAPIRPPAGTALAQTAATRQVTHIYDIREQQSYLPGDPYVLAGIDAGYRTLLVVPMLKNNELIGPTSIFRPVVQPFTDKQIALVTSFASHFVEAKSTVAFAAFHQLGRCIVMLKIHKHFRCSEWEEHARATARSAGRFLRQGTRHKTQDTRHKTQGAVIKPPGGAFHICAE